MLRTSSVIAVAAVSLTVALDAQAQRTERAFTASGRTCSEITWQPSVLARFPNIDDACQSVVEFDGQDFVEFNGTVRSVSARGDRLTMRFEGVDDEVELQTPEDMRVYLEGRPTRVRDLARGQELTFHVPASRFVAHFYEPGSETQFSEAQIAPAGATAQVAQAAPEPRRLPQTASFLPLVGFVGIVLVALGGLIRGAVGIARR